MFGKKRILAVDDSPISLLAIEQKLSNNYEIITVNSGLRALRYLKEEKPDLILLDVKMALKDGIETLKDIREMEGCASIPVIMLTSTRERGTIVESSKLGVYDYVLKPFDTKDLERRIELALMKAEDETAEGQDEQEGDGDSLI
ncbi:MAG: response regulator [Agathobacter sp.]|nr:response regulator [Agathobacter sp.]